MALTRSLVLAELVFQEWEAGSGSFTGHDIRKFDYKLKLSNPFVPAGYGLVHVKQVITCDLFVFFNGYLLTKTICMVHTLLGSYTPFHKDDVKISYIWILMAIWPHLNCLLCATGDFL